MRLLAALTLAAILTGCSQPEDFGARLLRECESAYAVHKSLNTGGYGRNHWIAQCIEERLKRA